MDLCKKCTTKVIKEETGCDDCNCLHAPHYIVLDSVDPCGKTGLISLEGMSTCICEDETVNINIGTVEGPITVDSVSDEGIYITSGSDTVGGEQFSIQYTIHCGMYSSQGSVTGSVESLCGTLPDCDSCTGLPIVADPPIAVIDTLGDRNSEELFTYDVSSNDTLPCVDSTYSLIPSSLINVTVTGVGPNFNITPTSPGLFSFEYEVCCDGQCSMALVSGNSVTAIVVPTATAGNFVGNDSDTGVSNTVDIVSSPDYVPCSSGVETYTISSTPNFVNITSSEISIIGSVFTVTPTIAGAWSFDYTILCDGLETSTGSISGTASSVVITPTATAVDDSGNNGDINSSLVIDVSTNDTPCSVGSTTYAIASTPNFVNISSSDVTLSGSVFTVTPQIEGLWSFDYEILCDGVVTSSGTVSGKASTPCPITSYEYYLIPISLPFINFNNNTKSIDIVFNSNSFFENESSPYSGGDLTVDWGDGVTDTFTGVLNSTGASGTGLTHTYASNGLYRGSIISQINGFEQYQDLLFEVSDTGVTYYGHSGIVGRFAATPDCLINFAAGRQNLSSYVLSDLSVGGYTNPSISTGTNINITDTTGWTSGVIERATIVSEPIIINGVSYIFNSYSDIRLTF